MYCMHVCMHACVHVCAYACMHGCIYSIFSWSCYVDSIYGFDEEATFRHASKPGLLYILMLLNVRYVSVFAGVV